MTHKNYAQKSETVLGFVTPKADRGLTMVPRGSLGGLTYPYGALVVRPESETCTFWSKFKKSLDRNMALYV